MCLRLCIFNIACFADGVYRNKRKWDASLDDCKIYTNNQPCIKLQPAAIIIYNYQKTFEKNWDGTTKSSKKIRNGQEKYTRRGKCTKNELCIQITQWHVYRHSE